MVHDLEDAIDEQLGDIIVSGQNARHETVEHLGAADVVLVHIQKTRLVVDLGGQLHGFFDHNDVAGAGLGRRVDHVDEGLGLAGTFGANDKFDHGIPP